EGRPLVTSRGVRFPVARGSMAYSAVTQPLPVLRRNGGTVSSTVAAHSTCVVPIRISAEPSAVTRYPVTISTGRISPASRVSVRISHNKVEKDHDQSHAHKNQDHARKRRWRRARGCLAFSPCGLEFGHKCDGITRIPRSLSDIMWLSNAVGQRSSVGRAAVL